MEYTRLWQSDKASRSSHHHQQHQSTAECLRCMYHKNRNYSGNTEIIYSKTCSLIRMLESFFHLRKSKVTWLPLHELCTWPCASLLSKETFAKYNTLYFAKVSFKKLWYRAIHKVHVGTLMWLNFWNGHSKETFQCKKGAKSSYLHLYLTVLFHYLLRISFRLICWWCCN